jgi:hypothetical protein
MPRVGSWTVLGHIDHPMVRLSLRLVLHVAESYLLSHVSVDTTPPQRSLIEHAVAMDAVQESVHLERGPAPGPTLAAALPMAARRLYLASLCVVSIGSPA